MRNKRVASSTRDAHAVAMRGAHSPKRSVRMPHDRCLRMRLPRHLRRDRARGVDLVRDTITIVRLRDLSDVELISAVDAHKNPKPIYFELESRPPSAAAAAAVVAHHQEGSWPPFLVAMMLQACRSPAGAPTALAILRGGGEHLSASYAAIALVRAIGRDAEPDLIDLVNAPRARIRSAVVAALAELDCARSLASVRALLLTHHLRPRDALRLVEATPIDDAAVLELLRSTLELERALGLELIHAQDRRSHDVDHAARAALERTDGVSPFARRALSSRLEG
jgi:hypothetical protein